MKRTYNTNIQIGESLTILLDEKDWERWDAKVSGGRGYNEPNFYPCLASKYYNCFGHARTSFLSLSDAQKLTDTIRSAYSAMEVASLEGKK